MASLDHWAHQSYHAHEVKSKTTMARKVKNASCQRKLPQNSRYNEVQRLLTFSKFPREFACSLILLARNGFIYTGKGTADDDTVMCVFCLSMGIGVRHLITSDDIETFHRKLNPNCSLVKGLDCGNKLIQDSKNGSFEAIFNQLYEFRKKESETIVLSVADDNAPPSNGESTILDSFEENLPSPNEEPLSSEVSRPSPYTSYSSNSLQQAVEGGASSQLITNHAQSMNFPWQNTNSEPVDNLSSLVNGTSSLPVADSNEDRVRPDGIPFSAPHSNAPPHWSSNETSNSNTNDNNGNQRSRPNASRPHEQNSAAPDSTRAHERANAPSNSQTSARNTSTPYNPQSPPQNSSSSQQDANVVQDGVTSYDKLGIFTARPKRPEYAVEQVRLQSFEGWPDNHHIKPMVLAKAGYFYTGYSDCARCFFCGGGLRNWEEGDDVWVEHARWFPKCTFIRQNMGQTFIDVVQDLSKEQEIIPYRDVIMKMESRGLEMTVPRDMEDMIPDLKKDVAVRITLDNGFTMTDTIRAAEKLKEMGHTLTCDLIFEELVKMNAKRFSPRGRSDIESGSLATRGKANITQGTMDSLISENNDLRQQSQCKICLDKEVAVVFLPCGHFVSCTDCSYALKACPICRQSIKGVVRACLS